MAGGPDEVHRKQIARLQLRNPTSVNDGSAEVLSSDPLFGSRARSVWIA